MTPRRLLIAALFTWCAAIVAAPWLSTLGGNGARAASILYDLFSRVCHQLDERSFHIAGAKFAVCIRCTSIYAAFFISVPVSPMLSRTFLASLSARGLLCAAALPMAIDVGLAAAGIHGSTGCNTAGHGRHFRLCARDHSCAAARRAGAHNSFTIE